MLKPRDNWTWYFDDTGNHLMLDLGDNMLFKTNLPRKLLVDYAVGTNVFCVDDATSFQTFKESLTHLDLSEPRQAELALYCVAAKRFHKPVQPKSWFFSEGQGSPCRLHEGNLVNLSNEFGKGLFIILEVGENVCLITPVELEGFTLREGKVLAFGEPIKVMHDRIGETYHAIMDVPVALVG
ncbi:cell division protein ZapC [Vibrio astriarenae]|uniref:cell division protein ZapC n=1 Tax=Vibrio astriarenae TaxID=1481923 RepID=UPI003736B410